MTEPKNIPTYDKNHYAVVDLGSNSFHLLITHLSHDVNSDNVNQVKIVNKVKRKVRLASGLDNNNLLSSAAIDRGLDCLKLFALHLQSIPLNNIKIVATAALRIATNRADFLDRANHILPRDINLLSGEQEAQTIYAGVAYTATRTTAKIPQQKTKQLVLDIGGASTEIVVGDGYKVKELVSLNIGCVSFNNNYFIDNKLNEHNFTLAITAATEQIAKVENTFISLGWHNTLGSSGTMQALAEILIFRQEAVAITLPFLYEIKQTLITCQRIDNIIIDGLRSDRSPVLASGLSILIALFTQLNITELNLSCGALREGLLFSLLPENTVLI
jgi:exopolyphosphatase/guanosine-5'-triphosphate,3'-diphosphate pyrophosphatase